jgi:hypothetical protein
MASRCSWSRQRRSGAPAAELYSRRGRGVASPVIARGKLIIVGLALTAVGCAVDRYVPNARLACGSSDDCPAGYQCLGPSGHALCCLAGTCGAQGDGAATDSPLDAGPDSAPSLEDAPVAMDAQGTPDAPIVADAPTVADAFDGPSSPADAGPGAEEIAFGCPPDPELRFCYTFDAPGDTLIDGSAHANHGMRNTAGTAPGMRGLALSFTTGQQMALVPEHPAQRLAGSRATFEAWIRPSASSGTDMVADSIVSKFTAMSGYTFGAYGRELRVYSSGTNARGAGQFALNAWTHAAVVMDTAGVDVYLDGVRVNGAPLAAITLVPNTEPMTIGHLMPGVVSLEASGFYGLVDVLRVYGRPKTPREICLDAFRTWSPEGLCRTVTSVVPQAAPAGSVRE